MTPERMARLARWWARLYTRNLPTAVAERRVGEIHADLHDHIAHERARGTAEGALALGIASRVVRGMAADASWRVQAIARNPTPKESKVKRSVVRVALVTVLVLLVPFLGVQFGEGFDWSVGDFVFAAVLLMGTGALLELAARNAGSVVFRVAAIVVALAAIGLGEADDAPGLVGFGCLVILGTIALSLRATPRSE